jgi:sugar lactone lactonase YvrE
LGGTQVSRRVLFHDRAGRAYEIFPGQHQLARLAPGGGEVWRLGGDGSSGFNFPVALAEDGQGRLYLLEKGAGRIQVLDHDGTRLASFKVGGRGASDLAIDPSDRLYVCEPSRHRVLVLDTAGRQLGEIGDSRLNGPRGVAIDRSGDLHVLDAGSARVLVFRPDGRFLRAYAGYGRGHGQLLRPHAIRLDERGRLVITDPAAGTLQAYHPSGACVAVWRPRLPDGRNAAPTRLNRGQGDRLMVCASPTV